MQDLRKSWKGAPLSERQQLRLLWQQEKQRRKTRKQKEQGKHEARPSFNISGVDQGKGNNSKKRLGHNALVASGDFQQLPSPPLKLDPVSHSVMSTWPTPRRRLWSRRYQNPDAYFWSYTYPGEPQYPRNRRWTLKEHWEFVDKLKKWKTGDDNWGLFSTVIYGRTGKQCWRYWERLVACGLIDGHGKKSKAAGKLRSWVVGGKQAVFLRKGLKRFAVGKECSGVGRLRDEQQIGSNSEVHNGKRRGDGDKVERMVRIKGGRKVQDSKRVGSKIKKHSQGEAGSRKVDSRRMSGSAAVKETASDTGNVGAQGKKQPKKENEAHSPAAAVGTVAADTEGVRAQGEKYPEEENELHAPTAAVGAATSYAESVYSQGEKQPEKESKTYVAVTAVGTTAFDTEGVRVQDEEQLGKKSELHAGATALETTTPNGACEHVQDENQSSNIDGFPEQKYAATKANIYSTECGAPWQKKDREVDPSTSKEPVVTRNAEGRIHKNGEELSQLEPGEIPPDELYESRFDARQLPYTEVADLYQPSAVVQQRSTEISKVVASDRIYMQCGQSCYNSSIRERQSSVIGVASGVPSNKNLSPRRRGSLEKGSLVKKPLDSPIPFPLTTIQSHGSNGIVIPLTPSDASQDRMKPLIRWKAIPEQGGKSREAKQAKTSANEESDKLVDEKAKDANPNNLSCSMRKNADDGKQFLWASFSPLLPRRRSWEEHESMMPAVGARHTSHRVPALPPNVANHLTLLFDGTPLPGEEDLPAPPRKKKNIQRNKAVQGSFSLSDSRKHENAGTGPGSNAQDAHVVTSYLPIVGRAERRIKALRKALETLVSDSISITGNMRRIHQTEREILLRDFDVAVNSVYAQIPRSLKKFPGMQHTQLSHASGRLCKQITKVSSRQYCWKGKPEALLNNVVDQYQSRCSALLKRQMDEQMVTTHVEMMLSM